MSSPAEQAERFAAWQSNRTIPLAESLALLRLVNACPYRSRDVACGCSGHRCGLRFGRPDAVVSHIDCLECVRRYEP